MLCNTEPERLAFCYVKILAGGADVHVLSRIDTSRSMYARRAPQRSPQNIHRPVQDYSSSFNSFIATLDKCAWLGWWWGGPGGRWPQTDKTDSPERGSWRHPHMRGSALHQIRVGGRWGIGECLIQSTVLISEPLVCGSATLPICSLKEQDSHTGLGRHKDGVILQGST